MLRAAYHPCVSAENVKFNPALVAELWIVDDKPEPPQNEMATTSSDAKEDVEDWNFLIP